MNKLRELISKEHDAPIAHGVDAINARDWLHHRSEFIADLIDAAKAHISVLDGHTEIYGDKLFPKTSDMLRKSIAKLEETK